jgi:hypothetical protein
MLTWRRGLQFAPDRSILPEWFASFEGSSYGGENSIDVQDIRRSDGAYDLVSLSHVLEFVPDDRKAFSELVRIGSECLILHVTFASSPFSQTSTHYEEPTGTFGRFHSYGLDAPQWLGAPELDLKTLIVQMVDPVTEVVEHTHFFCRQRNDAETLRAAFCAADPDAVPSYLS